MHDSGLYDVLGRWQLVFGNCGVLQGISQGKGFVNMSTVDVETATDVCEVSSRYICLICKSASFHEQFSCFIAMFVVVKITVI